MKISEIWRYPVKSMRGEQIEHADVGPDGIHGDRIWAVVDAKSGVSLSAKRYADLLQCHAWTCNDEVIIKLPSGREWQAGSTELARVLSELLERNVTTRLASATKTIKHEFPTSVREGEGEPFLWEPKTKAFFDSEPLHLLTTSTLAALQRLLPDSVIHHARFRPNFLVETTEAGFVENDWVNKDVTLGSLKCHVHDHTRRCVMVTRRQEDIPKDTDVIRTIVKNNNTNAGIALKALNSGTVHSGDKVETRV